MKSKPYWHIHHHTLLEFNIDPITQRRRFIKQNKSMDEVPIRLRLLKPIKGKLPSKVVRAAQSFVKAARDSKKMWDTVQHLYEIYKRARNDLNKAEGAKEEAYRLQNKAEFALGDVLKKHKIKIETLHAKECPDCPWDGQTIFPKKGVNQ